MSLEIRRLLSLLYCGKISNEQFIQKYFVDKPMNQKHVFVLLQNALMEKNAFLVEEVVVLLLSGHFFIKDFTLQLCDLLLVDWHFKHEDIAMLLRDARDPLAINCLYSAAEMVFDYLAYDDTYQFGRKCIKALSVINDDKAVVKLKLLTESDIPSIANYARKEIMRKNI